MTKTAELRETLDDLRRALDGIEQVASPESIVKGELSEVDRLTLQAVAKKLFESLKRAQSFLQGKALSESPAFLRLSRDDREFWSRRIEPRRRLLQEVYWRISEPLLAEFLVGTPEFSPASHAVREAFDFSLDHTEGDVEQWLEDGFFQEDHFDFYDFEGAHEVLSWPVFVPDIWRQNLREIRGVLLSIERALPRSISRVLSEVNRTFVFGQYLACVAMARAALEYAILSRVKEGALQIDTRDTAREGRVAGLDILIDRASKAISSLDADLWNYIRRSGNDVMHDLLAQENMSRVPESRARALSCMKKVHTAIEELYSV
jgi:Txe/YoeB family toxin of Txe-Axe toxin-antitoxin module